jgi:HSP20 family protein
MALMRWDPFEEMQRSLLGQPWGLGKTMAAPVSDVYVEDNTLVVEAQLPNFEEKEVDIQVHEGVLEIRAEHQEKQEDTRKNRRYVVRESSSSFYRSIALPANAQEDNIDAHFDKGMLKVVVPLTPKPEPKKITVQKKLAKGKE